MDGIWVKKQCDVVQWENEELLFTRRRQDILLKLNYYWIMLYFFKVSNAFSKAVFDKFLSFFENDSKSFFKESKLLSYSYFAGSF